MQNSDVIQKKYFLQDQLLEKLFHHCALFPMLKNLLITVFPDKAYESFVILRRFLFFCSFL